MNRQDKMNGFEENLLSFSQQALPIVTTGPQIVPSTVMKSEDMEGSRPDLYHDHWSDFYPSL